MAFRVMALHSLVDGYQHVRKSYSLYTVGRNETSLEMADYVGELEEENMYRGHEWLVRTKAVDEEMGFGQAISRLCPGREITPRPQYDYSLYFIKYDGKCHEDLFSYSKDVSWVQMNKLRQ
jgi:hypothetical protein